MKSKELTLGRLISKFIRESSAVRAMNGCGSEVGHHRTMKEPSRRYEIEQVVRVAMMTGTMLW
jgi:hypothetical protein